MLCPTYNLYRENSSRKAEHSVIGLALIVIGNRRRFPDRGAGLCHQAPHVEHETSNTSEFSAGELIKMNNQAVHKLSGSGHINSCKITSVNQPLWNYSIL